MGRRVRDRLRVACLLLACLLLACLLWPLAVSNAWAQGAPVLASVDDLVRVEYAPLRLNRATNTFDTTATLTNVSGQTAYGPLRLAMRSFSAAGVSLFNPTGVTPEGWAYLALPLPGEGLAPGQRVQNVVVRFANPGKVAFTFQGTVLGQRVLVRAPVASPGALLGGQRTAVRLTVFTFAPHGAVTQVSVHVGGTATPVLLRDDGLAPDLSGGDGVFTGTAEFDTAGMARGQCFTLRAEALAPGAATLSPESQLCVTEFPVGAVSTPGNLIPHPDNPAVQVYADQVLVSFVPGTTEQEIASVAASVQATVVGTLPRLGLYQLGFGLPLAPSEFAQKLAALRAHPKVAQAEPNALGSLAGDPKALPTEYASYAALVAQQNALAIIGAPEAWRVVKAAGLAQPLIVAVVDSGVDFSHTDLDSALQPLNCLGAATPANCQNDTTIPADEVGHGSFVAGVLGANTNNATGVAGASWGARILSLRVTPASGVPDALGLFQAIVRAESEGARVVNVSAGIYVNTHCALLHPVLANTLVVAAAGNGTTSNPNVGGTFNFFPASCPLPPSGLAGILGVANTQDNDTLHPSSNFGSSAQFAAPGTNLRSTVPTGTCTYCNATGYNNLTGTSFSTPLVSAAAILLRTLDASITPSALITALKNTGVPVVSPPAANPGLRRLDVCAAVLLANATNPPLRFDLAPSILENAGANALVGRLVPACDKVSYTLTNNAGGRFALDTTSVPGEIRVVRGATALDFETSATHSITVHAELTRDATVFADKTLQVTVVNVNEAPTINFISNLTILESAGLQTVNLAGISAGVGESGQTLTVTAGSNNTGLIPTPTVSYTSPAASGTLTFTPAPGASGSALITVTVRDSGGTANGGVDTTVRTFTVTVLPVNSAPAGTDRTINTALDTPYTFTTLDFGFSDPSDTPANNLLAVRISPPNFGALTLNGNPLAGLPPHVVTAAQIAQLRYNPVAGMSGTATFTFQVQDDGGTANGGVNLDQSPNTMTIVVAGLGTLDQSQPSINLDQVSFPNPPITVTGVSLAVGAGPQSQQKLAQVVKAGRSGTLVMVSFAAQCAGGNTLTIQVQGVDPVTKQPNGTVLSTRNFTGTFVFPPGPPLLRGFVLSTPVALTAGQEFAIVLTNPDPDTHTCTVFAAPPGDPYLPAQGYNAYFDARPNQPGWLQLSFSAGVPGGIDLPFQTFMTP